MAKQVVIVDDEQTARLKLRHLIDPLPNWKITAELSSGEALFEQLSKSSTDVVLLDIHMPGMNGIRVLQRLNQQGFAGEVIFTTAYSHHAIAAFDAAATDYVLKPVNPSRLQLALERAEQKLLAKTLPQSPQELVSRVGQRIRLIQVDAIDAIISSHGIQLAYCGNQTYPLNETLRELEALLPAHFLRAHRCAIVNRFRLLEAERWLNGRLLLRFMQSELEVLTSRSGARQLKKHLHI